MSCSRLAASFQQDLCAACVADGVGELCDWPEDRCAFCGADLDYLCRDGRAIPRDAAGAGFYTGLAFADLAVLGFVCVDDFSAVWLLGG